MREAIGDLWRFYRDGAWVAITTNGVFRADGDAVMGRGVAFQAKKIFPALPADLGVSLRRYGNHTHFFPQYRLASFPVKHHWKEAADLPLIKRSAEELARGISLHLIYLPRPGCGNGKLKWEDVKPIIAPILPDNVIVINRVP